MIFTLPGFDHWTFQVVMLGSLLVLEAINDGMVLSTVLEPMDSTHSRANALINRPCCALVSQRASGRA
jgi:hypothetical protein